MSIIYSIIARCTDSGLTTLCSYDTAKGNYPATTEHILKTVKIKSNITYKYNRQYNYHIVRDDRLLLVCLADNILRLETALQFLEAIRRKFRHKFNDLQIRSANAYDFNLEFMPTFEIIVNLYNGKKQYPDQKGITMKKLVNMQEVITENIEKVLNEEERIQIIVKKTRQGSDYLTEQVRTSNKPKATSLAFCHTKKSLIVVLAALCGLLIYMI